MTGQTQETKPLFQRLVQTIVPTHYDLTIQPHLDTFKFNGDVNIHLKVCLEIFCNTFFTFKFRLKNQQIVLYFMRLI
jgi:hypothetical protein